MVNTANRPQQVQLDLFSAVLHSYSAEREGRIDNATLYDQVASRAGIDPDEFARKSPRGRPAGARCADAPFLGFFLGGVHVQPRGPGSRPLRGFVYDRQGGRVAWAAVALN